MARCQEHGLEQWRDPLDVLKGPVAAMMAERAMNKGMSRAEAGAWAMEHCREIVDFVVNNAAEKSAESGPGLLEALEQIATQHHASRAAQALAIADTCRLIAATDPNPAEGALAVAAVALCMILCETTSQRDVAPAFRLEVENRPGIRRIVMDVFLEPGAFVAAARGATPPKESTH